MITCKFVKKGHIMKYNTTNESKSKIKLYRTNNKSDFWSDNSKLMVYLLPTYANNVLVSMQCKDEENSVMSIDFESSVDAGYVKELTRCNMKNQSAYSINFISRNKYILPITNAPCFVHTLNDTNNEIVRLENYLQYSSGCLLSAVYG